GGFEFTLRRRNAKNAGGSFNGDAACVQNQLNASVRFFGLFAFGKQQVENRLGGAIAEELAKGFLVPGNMVALDEFKEVLRLIKRERGLGVVRIGGEE